MGVLKYDLYIAGAMHGRSVGEVLRERAIAKFFCKAHKLSYYDPAADEGLDKLNKNAIIDSKPNLKLMRHYVKKDDSHLDRCYYLLVLTGDISSSGTAWEMGRTYYKNRRPIILVSPKQHMGSLVNFTTVKATKIYPSIFDAVLAIAKDKKKRKL